MQKQDIIDKVRTIMNETGSEEQWTLLSEDTVKLDAYIESVIPDAMNMLMGLQEVDPFMMPWSNVSNGSASTADSCTVVTLPADFLIFNDLLTFEIFFVFFLTNCNRLFLFANLLLFLLNQKNNWNNQN